MSHSAESEPGASPSGSTESPRADPPLFEAPEGSAVSVGARRDSPTVISARQHLASSRAQAVQPPEIIARLRGERLGHFVLDDLIGTGGMAAVFLARDTRLDRPVALKVLPQTPEMDPDLIQRFDNEARAAARLEHENVARVYFVGEDRGVHFIAFEFIDGTNLRDLIEQSGRLPLAEAVNYCLQITGALVHAASRDVVHRDIKPSNIIITSAGRAKLVDMGLARRYETDREGGVTQSGVTLGTFDYISPEQARDPRTADARSDIYSLGCTLYNMLTGQPPFPEGTIAQKLLAHQAEEPPSPQERNPQVPDDLAAIVAKMMAKQPRRRYRDPEQLYRDLLLMAGSLGLRSTSPEGLIWMSPTRPYVPAWERYAPLTIPLVALLMVAGFLFFWQRKAEKSDLMAQGFRPFETIGQPGETTSAAERPEPTDDPQTPLGGQGPRDTGSDPGASDHAAREAQEDFPGSQMRAPALSEQTNGLSEPSGTQEQSRLAASSDATETSTDRESGRVGDMHERDASVNEADDGPRYAVRGPSVKGGIAARIPGTGVRADLASGRRLASSRSTAPRNRENENTAYTAVPVEEPSVASEQHPFDFPPEPRSETTPTRQFEDGSSSPVSPRDPSIEPMPPPLRPNTLVVDPQGAGERVYRTIEAALEEAASDSASIIELRYDGYSQEGPFKINGIRVTIRPAEGFEPVLVFVPREVPTQGYRTRVISVSGGSLSLVDLHVELHLPKGGDRWSLFHLQDPEKLSLEGCTVTLRNPSAQNAAMVEVASLASLAVPLGALTADSTSNPIELEFRDCFLRADADVILARQPQAIRIDFTNNVVAASGRLLHVMGAEQSRPDEHIELGIDHTSVRTDGGLVLLEATETAPHLVPVRMTTSDNVLQTQAVALDDSPLIKIVGPRDTDSLAALVRENGSVGVNNFYEGYEIFREIRSSSGNNFMTTTTGRSTWNFDAWQTFRGSQESEPRHNQVRWLVAPGGVAPTEMDLLDWALADGPNPARGGTSDGADAGANLDEVPYPPAGAEQ